ncbi:hypothetical protein L1987_54252 [Smallanthus sonchifolius]|uniref:Uncharacterized protein n=1 Tax=Smallanthus sonchifolius TaxID=185202 RepID=A0ACB9E795_9ASTR|nr:hypothetical protein L1987_54252 [Smallanthus sonchifolius]
MKRAILRKQYDLASTLLDKYPEFAMKNDQILMAIAKTFPTDLGFIESFIYPSLKNVCQKIVVRGSLLLHFDVLHKCLEDILWVVRSCKNKYCMILLVPIAIFYPIYELICLLILVLRFPFSVLYCLLWKVLAIIDWHLHLYLVARQVQHCNYNESSNGGRK